VAKIISSIAYRQSGAQRSLGRNDENRVERNLVIHVGAGAGPRAGGRGDLAGRSGRAELAATVFAEIRAPATGTGATGTAGAVEQCQLAAKALQHDLGRIAVLAGLVLPLARLQRTFDENLRALFQILLGDPAQILVEDDDAVPFGLFTPLAGGLVFPGFRCGQAQIGDRPAVLGATDLWIGAQIADQNHFVHASRHDTPRSFTLGLIATAREICPQ